MYLVAPILFFFRQLSAFKSPTRPAVQYITLGKITPPPPSPPDQTARKVYTEQNKPADCLRSLLVLVIRVPRKVRAIRGWTGP